MEKVDVAVIGGGPAGTSAGRAAAQQGADTIVLEKGVPRADRQRLGADSTDAAGMLDYWVNLMDLPEPVPDEVILQELDGASLVGPNERVTLRDTGMIRAQMESSYPHFGFTFHRARFDDWLREQCLEAGAGYRTGTAVREVTTGYHNIHTLTLQNGHELEAEYLILADGPQRTVTRGVLKQFISENHLDGFASTQANHIGYQEYREFPPELFDDNLIKFWWGMMPGHTAYPWIFPNDGNVARVGLTMPIEIDISDVRDTDNYRFLRSDDTSLPSGGEYIQRLLETEYPEYNIETDFPLVKDRGKRNGVESYPISSTRPIDSPTEANIAIVGGAMGATSAFHEGGDHMAVRTGKIAGSLAGAGNLSGYNKEWKRAVGKEIRRNVAMADVVRNFEPSDWDRIFRSMRRMLKNGKYSFHRAPLVGFDGFSILARFLGANFGYRNGSYIQITESEYTI